MASTTLDYYTEKQKTRARATMLGDHLSMGVELEFLVAVAAADQDVEVPDVFKGSEGGPVILPPRVQLNDHGLLDYALEEIRRAIAGALREGRGDRIIQSNEDAHASPDGHGVHLRNCHEWVVETDKSIECGAIGLEKDMEEYRWVPVEIKSPALWVNAASWDEIRRVVQAVHDQFWIHLPPTAGMHYHVGRGFNYLPFRALRRLAAVCVAADPLLVQLHPEHRRNNYTCLSPRLYSRVAHGAQAADIAREIGAEWVQEGPQWPKNQPLPTPSARPYWKRTPDFDVWFKRGELIGYEFDSAIFLEPDFDDHVEGGEDDDDDEEEKKKKKKNARPVPILDQVRQILQCPNAPTLAEMMRYSEFEGDRPAYNFSNHAFPYYLKIQAKGTWDKPESLPTQPKRTVEFRQMAATMEPDEVVAHGKVAVGLCEYAMDANIDNLWTFVLHCAVAEEHGDWFDIFDLLDGIGLLNEARVLQHAIERFRKPEDPEEIGDDDEGLCGQGEGGLREWILGHSEKARDMEPGI